MDFAATKKMFHLPKDVIYLDGNSLGPLPKTTQMRVQKTIEDEWGTMLIRGWNEAGWFVQPTKVGNRIAKLIGAETGSITVGDTLSIRMFQALSAALGLVPDRTVILSDSGNFPTDLYMAEGLIKALGRGHQLKIVAPNEVSAYLTKDTAVLMLTEVDYRTGAKHDMAALTQQAHGLGIVTVWDLAHSAGALPVDLKGCNVDFAAGCTYKYLNGGPGAPAFLYVAPRHGGNISPILPGWMGHDSPFAFDLRYLPADGIERMRIGTPPVIAMAALEASLDIWDTVDMAALRHQSIRLGDLLIGEVARLCPDLQLLSPLDGNLRGSQVSFGFSEGYAAIQALIARGIIGDFRAPDIMRFGISPLYNDEADILSAAQSISDVINHRHWDAPRFLRRNLVT